VIRLFKKKYKKQLFFSQLKNSDTLKFNPFTYCIMFQSIHQVPLVVAKAVHTVCAQHLSVRCVNEQKSIRNMQLLIDKKAMDNIHLPML
jgi:hypothetical protein